MNLLPVTQDGDDSGVRTRFEHPDEEPQSVHQPHILRSGHQSYPHQQSPKVNSSSASPRLTYHTLTTLLTPNSPVMTPQAISIEGKNQLGLVLVKMI